MGEGPEKKRFDERILNRWRIIQISSLLPLTLIGGLMIYYEVNSRFGIVVFFLILILGVIIPQLRGDLVLSHLLLAKEFDEKLDKVKADMKADMLKLLEDGPSKRIQESH
jgi:hypothetical protein